MLRAAVSNIKMGSIEATKAGISLLLKAMCSRKHWTLSNSTLVTYFSYITSFSYLIFVDLLYS